MIMVSRKHIHLYTKRGGVSPRCGTYSCAYKGLINMDTHLAHTHTHRPTGAVLSFLKGLRCAVPMRTLWCATHCRVIKHALIRTTWVAGKGRQCAIVRGHEGVLRLEEFAGVLTWTVIDVIVEGPAPVWWRVRSKQNAVISDSKTCMMTSMTRSQVFLPFFSQAHTEGIEGRYRIGWDWHCIWQ